MTLGLASKIFFLWLAIAAVIASPILFTNPEPGVRFALFFIAVIAAEIGGPFQIFIEHKHQDMSHIKSFTLSSILVSTIFLLVWANGAFSDL